MYGRNTKTAVEAPDVELEDVNELLSEDEILSEGEAEHYVGLESGSRKHLSQTIPGSDAATESTTDAVRQPEKNLNSLAIQGDQGDTAGSEENKATKNLFSVHEGNLPSVSGEDSKAAHIIVKRIYTSTNGGDELHRNNISAHRNKQKKEPHPAAVMSTPTKPASSRFGFFCCCGGDDSETENANKDITISNQRFQKN